ncbi:MAG: hypothetical protein KDN19_13405 [Verrucomicrobiae bacterium]|nr:hypothetical protein [Verrucomicrobiae bacterium]
MIAAPRQTMGMVINKAAIANVPTARMVEFLVMSSMTITAGNGTRQAVVLTRQRTTLDLAIVGSLFTARISFLANSLYS